MAERLQERLENAGEFLQELNNEQIQKLKDIFYTINNNNNLVQQYRLENNYSIEEIYILFLYGYHVINLNPDIVDIQKKPIIRNIINVHMNALEIVLNERGIPIPGIQDGGNLKRLKKSKKTKVRKHKGIVQTGGRRGKLKKGYRYTGKKTKSGLPIIKKC